MNPEYNPMSPVAPLNQIRELVLLDIERSPEDKGRHWHGCYRLIENVVCRDDEVAQSLMDPGKETLYIALTGETYDIDELAAIDARMRQLIAKVALFGS